MNSSACFRLRSAVERVNARVRSAQATTTGPSAQLVHGLGGGDGYRHDITSRLGERNVEKRSKTTARANLGTGPRTVIGACLTFGNPEVGSVETPDRVPFLARRQIQKEDTIESLGPGELWRQLAHIVGSANEEHIRFMVSQPR